MPPTPAAPRSQKYPRPKDATSRKQGVESPHEPRRKSTSAGASTARLPAAVRLPTELFQAVIELVVCKHVGRRRRPILPRIECLIKRDQRQRVVLARDQRPGSIAEIPPRQLHRFGQRGFIDFNLQRPRRPYDNSSRARKNWGSAPSMSTFMKSKATSGATSSSR